jgi:hypothetical protein
LVVVPLVDVVEPEVEEMDVVSVVEKEETAMVEVHSVVEEEEEGRGVDWETRGDMEVDLTE